MKYLRQYGGVAEFLFLVAAIVLAIHAYDLKDKQVAMTSLGMFIVVLVIDIVLNESKKSQALLEAQALGKPLAQHEILKIARDMDEGTKVEVYTTSLYTEQPDLGFHVAHYNCTLELVREVSAEHPSGRLYRLYKFTLREQQGNTQVIRQDYS